MAGAYRALVWVFALCLAAIVAIVALAGCDPDDIGPAQKPIPPASSPAATR